VIKKIAGKAGERKNVKMAKRKRENKVKK